MAATTSISVRSIMANFNMPDRMRAASSQRSAWLIAAAAVFLACAADSPVGISARNAPAISGRGSGSETNFSFSITPADHTVHLRFARVRPQGAESVSDFMERVFAAADAAGARRLVLDLSATNGGDSFLVVPLVKGILARNYFTTRGGLIVIVGPNTFSPAQNAAAMLQRYAHPIFVESPVI